MNINEALGDVRRPLQVGDWVECVNANECDELEEASWPKQIKFIDDGVWVGFDSDQRGEWGMRRFRRVDPPTSEVDEVAEVAELRRQLAEMTRERDELFGFLDRINVAISGGHSGFESCVQWVRDVIDTVHKIDDCSVPLKGEMVPLWIKEQQNQLVRSQGLTQAAADCSVHNERRADQAERERDELRDSLQRISNNLNEPVILDRIKHMDDTPLNRSYGASHLCKELAQTRQGFTELGEKYDVAKRQLEWLEKQLHGSDGYIATARELRVEIGERAKERDAEAVRADAAIAEANDLRTKLAAAEAERERMQCGHLRSSIVTSIESNSNWCGECDMHSRLSDAIQMEKHNKEQWDREKERRVYYQDIVYAVCNLLDSHLGYTPGQGIVTGTVETPSTMVSDTLEKVLLRCKQLDKAEADAAAMRRTMTENESRLKDVIRRIGVSTTTGWITHELNHVLLDIPSGTAGRELLDRHKAKLAAKDAEIEQERKLSRSCMSQNARLVRKSRTAKTALFEHYRGKIDPAWFGEKSELYKYRTTANPSGVIWRTSDGKSCKASMVGHAWITATAYSSWQECCDDKRTYPCNADGTPLAKSDDDAALLRKLRELLQGKTISYHSGTAGVCVSLTHAQTYIDTLIAIRDGGK